MAHFNIKTRIGNMRCCDWDIIYTPFLTVLPDIKVEVSKKNSKDFAICKVVKQSVLHNETRRITCLPGVSGSIVRITSTASKALSLSLSEVKVYGSKLVIYLYYYTYL